MSPGHPLDVVGAGDRRPEDARGVNAEARFAGSGAGVGPPGAARPSLTLTPPSPPKVRTGAPDNIDRAAPARISLSRGTWLALTGAFVVLTVLLTLTVVILTSQRQKTVLLNQQIATLITEATVVLHGVAPALNAVPARSSTIKARANSLAHLVSQAGPFLRRSESGRAAGDAR